MSDIITQLNIEVIDNPTLISVQEVPININVSELGQQGLPGPPGADGDAGSGGGISTGNADLRYYPLNNNPSGYITGFNSGQYITNNQTGQFYPASNLNQYIRSGDVLLLYYTKNNESGFLNSLSGLSIAYVQNISGVISERLELTGSNLSNQITNIMNNTGNFISNSQTGQFYPNSNPAQFVNSGNITTTGQTLYNLILGLTGQLDISGSQLSSIRVTGSSSLQVANFTGVGNVTLSYSGNKIYVSGDTGHLIGYATVSNLASTGQQNWITANSNGINLSGNLQSTGTILNDRILSLSGYANDSFATINNLQSTGSNLYSYIVGLSGISQRIMNPVTGFGTNFYLPRFTLDGSGVYNSNIIDSGNAINFFINNPDSSITRVLYLTPSGQMIVGTGNPTFPSTGAKLTVYSDGRTVEPLQRWYSSGRFVAEITSDGERFEINRNSFRTVIGGLPGSANSFVGLWLAGNNNPSASNYSFLGDGSTTYINATTNSILFRIANTTRASAGPNGFGIGLGQSIAPTHPFQVSGSNGSFVVNSSNNVGVNCLVPTSRLDVSGIITSSGFSIPSIKSSGTPITLGSSSFYIHTGHQQDSWLLPTAASAPGKFYFLKNRGASIILTGNSNTETLFTTTTVLTLTIASGEAYIVASDSVNSWMIL